jgi:hypothetical protein
VVKQCQKEGGEIGKTTFCIRQNVVLAALHWLKKHSIECQDIVIQQSNLDWMKDKEGQEQDLPPCDIELDAESTDVKPSVQDRGPAPSQVADVLDRQEEGEEEETVFGMLPGMSPHLPKEKDSPITKSLQEETQQSKTNNSGEATINFPHVVCRQEQDLPPCDIELDAESMGVKPSVQDRGPAPSQAADVLDRQEEGEEEETAFGTLPGMTPHLPKEKDSPMTKSLQEATQQSKTNNSGEATINFPHVDPNPVSEHDVNSGLFAKAFPWLFPGGRGDHHQFRNTKLAVGD